MYLGLLYGCSAIYALALFPASLKQDENKAIILANADAGKLSRKMGKLTSFNSCGRNAQRMVQSLILIKSLTSQFR